MPAARARSTNRKYRAFSKKSWVTRKSTPASTLVLRWARSRARSRVSTWPSGYAAAPMQKRQRSGRARTKATSSLAYRKPSGCGVKVVSPRGGSPRSASTFWIPASATSSRTPAISSRDDPDAGDVGHRLDLGVALEPLHELDRLLPGRAARAVGDRHVRRPEGPQRLHRLEERALPLRRLRREELEGEDGLAALAGVPDEVGDLHGGGRLARGPAAVSARSTSRRT